MDCTKSDEKREVAYVPACLCACAGAFTLYYIFQCALNFTVEAAADAMLTAVSDFVECLAEGIFSSIIEGAIRGIWAAVQQFLSGYSKPLCQGKNLYRIATGIPSRATRPAIASIAIGSPRESRQQHAVESCHRLDNAANQTEAQAFFDAALAPSPCYSFTKASGDAGPIGAHPPSDVQGFACNQISADSSLGSAIQHVQHALGKITTAKASSTLGNSLFWPSFRQNKRAVFTVQDGDQLGGCINFSKPPVRRRPNAAAA